MIDFVYISIKEDLSKYVEKLFWVKTTIDGRRPYIQEELSYKTTLLESFGTHINKDFWHAKPGLNQSFQNWTCNMQKSDTYSKNKLKTMHAQVIYEKIV